MQSESMSPDVSMNDLAVVRRCEESKILWLRMGERTHALRSYLERTMSRKCDELPRGEIKQNIHDP